MINLSVVSMGQPHAYNDKLPTGCEGYVLMIHLLMST